MVIPKQKNEKFTDPVIQNKVEGLIYLERWFFIIIGFISGSTFVTITWVLLGLDPIIASLISWICGAIGGGIIITSGRNKVQFLKDYSNPPDVKEDKK